MGAIKHQGFIADSERLSSRYGGVPVIYVESEEDTSRIRGLLVS